MAGNAVLRRYYPEEELVDCKARRPAPPTPKAPRDVMFNMTNVSMAWRYMYLNFFNVQNVLL